MSTEEAFTSSVAASVLASVCGRLSLPAEDAQLLRLGENAIFYLPGVPAVARVSRPGRMERARRELCVAGWLIKQGVRALAPYDHVEQPLLVGDHVVSFWTYIDSGDGAPGPTARDLAELLLGYHGAGESPCELPGWDPMSEVPRRLQAAHGIDDASLAFLDRRYREVNAKLGSLRTALGAGPIHGDAHTGNLLGRTGQAYLTDFEAACVGPREWDLVPVAVAAERFRRHTAHEEMADAYGFDVTGWDGYPLLREVRELGMVTWLMQNVGESTAAADEFELRLDSLRTGDRTREWHVF